MLRKNPRVRRWAETGDVLQTAVLRLLRSLESVSPPTTKDFFSLAATQIRRELIDLARHYCGAHGLGGNHASGILAGDSDKPGFEPPADEDSPEAVAAWSEFHEKAAQLPDLERVVMDLHYYQGLSLIDAARAMGISERSAQVYWKRAKLKLHELLGGTWPEI
jgi:RNA polymerase sigma-70 factor (ECF subfamily)